MRSVRPIPPLLSLRVFEAVARHLSFSSAAQELNVTQSAVSHHIKKLEEDLGLPLFARRPRAVALTEAGQAYQVHVAAAFERLRLGTEAIRAASAPSVLTVGLLASFGTRWLASRLRGFHAAHPGIELRLRPDIALADLARGEVDVAIRYGRGKWPGLRARKLMPERLAVVCAPALLAGPGRPPRRLRPQDLLRFPILSSHASEPFEWAAWAARFGLDLGQAQTVHLHDYNIVVEAALAGQGIAMGRHRLIGPHLASGALVHALPGMVLDDPDIGWWLVTANGPRGAALETFCDWLMAVAAQAVEEVGNAGAAPLGKDDGGMDQSGSSVRAKD